MTTTTTHGPVVFRDGLFVPWDQNSVNVSSVSVQYGYGCLDGLVATLSESPGGDLALVIPDGFAHAGRHIYNSLRSVHFRSDSELGSLQDTLDAARKLDFSYFDSKGLYLPKSATGMPSVFTFIDYVSALVDLQKELFNRNFPFANYIRPFYSPTQTRLDEVDNDFAIAGSSYRHSISIMAEAWPRILGPRHPGFLGAPVLVVSDSTSPHPDSSLIRFKHSSAYAPHRGPAVAQKERYAKETGELVGDVLLPDYSRKVLTEGSGSNLFVVRKTGNSIEVITPPLEGVFPGVTQEIIFNFLTKYGEDLGINVSRKEIPINREYLEELSKNGGEIFLAGSAAGIFPVSQLVVPKSLFKKGEVGYEKFNFATGTETVTALIRDFYRCFSVAQACQIRRGARADLVVDEYASHGIVIPLPRSVSDSAREYFQNFNPAKKLPKPSDQCLTSGRVTALQSTRQRVY